MMNLYEYCLYLITLLCLGSYCGSFCYRWPLKQHLNEQRQAREILGITAYPQHSEQLYPKPLSKRSRCPHCQHKLSIFELFPILSYLFLKGRCRHCQLRISNDYLMIEILVLLTCAPLPWIFDQPIEVALHGLILCSLITAAFIDKNHYLLPDPCAFLVLICGLALVLEQPSLAMHLSGAFLGFFIIYGIGRLYFAVRKIHGIGLGDAKLNGALAAWLGIFHLADILVCASLLGILYSIGQSKLKTTHLAFGPFLACSGIGLFYIQVLWQ